MVLIQKYYYWKDVDEEYRPTLTHLLRDYIPDFSFLLRSEQKNHHAQSYIFLFFGERGNSPIGVAQLNIKEEVSAPKISFFPKLFKKVPTQNTKSAELSIDGLSIGYIFLDEHYQNCSDKLKEILKDYLPEDIEEVAVDTHIIKAPGALQGNRPVVQATFINTFDNYAAYYRMLAEKERHLIEQKRDQLSYHHIKFAENLSDLPLELLGPLKEEIYEAEASCFCFSLSKKKFKFLAQISTRANAQDFHIHIMSFDEGLPLCIYIHHLIASLFQREFDFSRLTLSFPYPMMNRHFSLSMGLSLHELDRKSFQVHRSPVELQHGI